MCQEFPGSPPAIVNKDADDEGGLQAGTSPVKSLAFRRRVILLGRAASGKTSLAKSLVSGSTQTSDEPTGTVDVHTWFPFLGTTYEHMLDRELSGYERSLVLDVWDLAAKNVWQGFHHLFLTRDTLVVIVFNLADQDSCDEVAKTVDLIRAKVPANRMLIVGTHVDKVSQDEKHTNTCKDILGAIRNRHAHFTQKVRQEVHNIRNMAPPITPIYEQRLKHLQSMLEGLPDPPSVIVRSSNKTATGVDDVRRDLLQAVLDSNRNSSAEQGTPIRPATAEVYDEIVALRKEFNIVVPSPSIHNLFLKHTPTLNASAGRKEIAFLETAGVIQCFCNSGDQDDDLICIDPPQFAKALCLIHMSDTKKAFRFEAKRFWPKSSNGRYKKPNPALLVQALEEIATEGLIRECVFPLLWQDFQMNEKQTRLVISLMVWLGLLNRSADTHNNAEKKTLELPNFSGLVADVQYRLPLLGLTPDVGPTLNWTPWPFQGDAQIGWRFSFPLGTPPGLIPRLLVVCRARTRWAMYRHHWKNGLLLKMGQVSVHISQGEASQIETVDVTVRVTLDEEGTKKATEVMWVVLARFLVTAETFLETWPGVYYQMSILPSSTYYTPEVPSGSPSVEIGVLQFVRWSSSANQTRMDVCVEDEHYEVDMECLHPLPGEAGLSIFEWLQWLAGLDIHLSDDSPSEQEDTSSVGTSSQGSLRQLHPMSPPCSSSSSPQSPDGSGRTLTSPPVNAGKKKVEIKWKLDNGWKRISVEDEAKEINKVAASFVAAVLASSVAQFIMEQSNTNNTTGRKSQQQEAKNAAARASARAAQAAHSGDPEAAAMAVVAAVKAIDDAMVTSKKKVMKNNTTGTTKSRMCVIM